MADEINYIKVASEELCNKYQGIGYFDNVEYNTIIKLSQLDEINYQRQAFESGSIKSDNLRTLKRTKQDVVDGFGKFYFPSDYMFFDSARSISFYKDSFGNQKSNVIGVDILKDNEIGDRLSSQIKQPTKDNPCAVIYSDHLQFYPYGVNTVTISYLKKPEDPVWNFTEVNNEQGYTYVGSTNIELPSQLIPSLIMRVCAYFGVTVRQQDIVSYMEQKNANSI